MALQQIKFAPGIDKQDTSVGAVGRWIDSDNVRFRYGLPEKVGGWQSLLPDTLVGVARKQHAIVLQLILVQLFTVLKKEILYSFLLLLYPQDQI